MVWYFGWIWQSLLVVLLWTTSCSTTIGKRQEARSGFELFSDLQPYILAQKPDIHLFRREGPFSYQVLRDFAITLSPEETADTDVYFSDHRDKAPLVILQHGNKADKDEHRNQARRLASWGMHVMIVSLPAQGRWIQNGHTLTKLIHHLYASPDLLDDKFDRHNIILAGHSFGGSAAAIVAGSQAPIKGAIFLDPALFGQKVRSYIGKITVPAIVLGADRRVFKSIRRQDFFRYMKRNALEISIRDATHNDAQNPAKFSLPQFLGFERPATPNLQAKFTAALIASVFSLAATGENTFAWNAFQPAIASGEFIDARRK